LRILISNDDGYRSEGLKRLAEALRPLAEVTVVAPDRNRSGASNSLTLHRPLRVWQEGPEVYCVDGTPTDCVHLAITGLLEHEPDMVISGINDGPNLGDDVLYSGTVAAAMEGRFCGLPAIAISLAGTRPTNYDTAARVAHDLVARLLRAPLPADAILNVNVPDLPHEQLAGMRATRLGHRHRAEPVVPAEDPRGRRIYWVGPAGPEQDAGPGTDFHAVGRGFVSVTPLQADLTRHAALAQVEGWLAGTPGGPTP
jgi:5'-nucleotidase